MCKSCAIALSNYISVHIFVIYLAVFRLPAFQYICVYVCVCLCVHTYVYLSYLFSIPHIVGSNKKQEDNNPDLIFN